MMGWNNMMGGYGWFGGGLLSLQIVGALVVGIVFLVRNSNSGAPSRTQSATSQTGTQYPTPIDILETRYAKGEIDKEEYEQRRKDLESASVGTR